MKKINLAQQPMSSTDMRQEQSADLGAKAPFDGITYNCGDGQSVQCSGTVVDHVRSGADKDKIYGVTCDGVNYLCPGVTDIPSGFDCRDKKNLAPDVAACCEKFPGDFCEYVQDYTRYSGTCAFKKNPGDLSCY